MSANNNHVPTIPDTPRDLKQQLHAVMTLFWISIPGFTLLEERARSEPEWDYDMKTRYHTEPFGISPLLNALRQPHNSEAYQFYYWNFLVQLARSTLPQAFQIVDQYCRKHKIQELFSEQPWYGFLLTLRNAFTHDGRLSSHGKDKKIALESEWRGKRITKEMIGKPVPLSFFDLDDLIRLIDDIGRFIDDLKDLEAPQE